MKKAMFKTCMLLLCTIGTAAIKAQPVKAVTSITVKGTVTFVSPSAKESKVWLLKESLTGKPVTVDSCLLQPDHTFSFTIHQDHQGAYTIDAMHFDRASFWSDAAINITMRGFDTARHKVKIPHYNYVDGSYENNFINLYQLNDINNYNRFVDEYNLSYYAKKSTDTAFVKYLQERTLYSPIEKDLQQRQDVLLRMYKGLPVTVYAIKALAGTQGGEKYDRAMQLLDELIAKYPWLTEAKNLKESIAYNANQQKKLIAGQPMPTVQYPAADGSMAGLDQYKGKYLLVDFWASWCGPCRAAIPKVIALYEQYKDKGFAVASISIDTDKKAWEKALKEENMPWLQLLSDNKENTTKLFQFTGIPTMYLVDPDGNIIERFTGYTEDAEARLKSILQKGVPASFAPNKTTKISLQSN